MVSSRNLRAFCRFFHLRKNIVSDTSKTICASEIFVHFFERIFMNCIECRWFNSQKTEVDQSDGTWRVTLLGNCRKYPPRQFVFPDTSDATSGWPTTRGCDWCGEWEDVVDDSSSTTGPTLPGRRWTDWEYDRERILEVAKKANKSSPVKPASS